MLGHKWKATSPNERFTAGAQAINLKPLYNIEVHGKNLFYFFGAAPSPVVLHFHFGMSGHFRTARMPGPDPTPTTRLLLSNEQLGVVALLSAMTVNHGGWEYYQERIARLGPDPLREDASFEAFKGKVATSKKSIGQLLMDQSAIAGVGNIYRAEILYKAGVHPEQPACSLPEGALLRVWLHSVDLLQRGFLHGSILTVDAPHARALGKPWTRRYIYNHSHCGRCRARVRTWAMAGRTVYACTTCQRLLAGTHLPEARQKSVAGSQGAKEFISHCAPDDGALVTPSKMTIA